MQNHTPWVLFRSFEEVIRELHRFPKAVPTDTRPQNGQRLKEFGFNPVIARIDKNEITSVQSCSSFAMSVYLKQVMQMYLIQLGSRKACALHYMFLFNEKKTC